MQRKLLVFAVVATLFGNTGCAETSVPSDWPRDCVGRLELTLPGESDQSAMLPEDQFRHMASAGYEPNRFPDGEKAGWTDFWLMEITHPLTGEERQQVINKFRSKRGNLTKDVKANSKISWHTANDNDNSTFGPLRRDLSASFITVNNIYLAWRQSAPGPEELSRAKAHLQLLAAGVRPRALFDAPKESGLCLPYLFIADEGKERHDIAMTYRLKAHPDITVNLKSSSSGKSDETNKDLSDQYWDTRTAPGRLKSARTIWRLPANRPTHLAGREGLESFVAVVRDDSKEEDFIYHAVAVGNPGAPEDAPDVRLVVEQTRENAIKRGIKPMTEDEVLKLARQIAASVSKRAKR